MLKKRWFVALIALVGGFILGTASIILIENPAQPTAFLTLIKGNESNSKLVYQSDYPNTLNELKKREMAQLEENDTLGPAGRAHSGTSANLTDEGNLNSDTRQPEESKRIEEEIIADYKQNIGTLFEAWKTTNIAAFREKLEKAYMGDILEKHVEKARPYIEQGIGMNVVSIEFHNVTVEQFTSGTATLQADYTYRASDYNTLDQADLGGLHEQIVHVRVNLIKMNSHWYITGETILG